MPLEMGGAGSSSASSSARHKLPNTSPAARRRDQSSPRPGTHGRSRPNQARRLHRHSHNSSSGSTPRTPKTSGPNRASETGVGDVVLEFGSIMLQTLEKASQLAPVPYLREASGLVLGIFEMLQKTHDNKAAYRELANDAGSFVYSILQVWTKEKERGSAISEELQTQLEDLVNILRSVETLVAKRIQRNGFLRFMLQGTDAGKVRELRNELKQAVDKFGVQSHVRLRLDVEQLLAQQREITQALSSSTSPRHSKNLERDASQDKDGPSPFLPSARPASRDGGSSYTSIGGNYNVVTNNVSNKASNVGNVSSVVVRDSGNVVYNGTLASPLEWR